jgi:CelD/BcsL family acetyltransferase involved in cellulose biosynthesis
MTASTTALGAPQAGGGSGLKFEIAVADSFEGAPVSPREWDEFVLSVRGDIYVSFDWCLIWWRHYGRGRALHLFVYRQSGRLVGLAPMFVERVRLGPVSLKIGKRVGADHALTIFSLPISPHYSEQVYSHVVTSLINAEKCDAVWIGLCPGDDPTMPGLEKAASAKASFVSLIPIPPSAPQTLFDLPATFGAYVKKLDSRQRQNYRRRLKLLGNAYRIDSEVIADPSRAEGSFADFVSAHERQWMAEGKLGHFGDWPLAAEFNSELVRSLSKSGRYRMLYLRADGATISYQYGFVFGDRFYWRLPARTTEAGFERFGLGVLGLVQLIEAMIGEGVRSIEAGLGHYDYKIHFGGKEVDTRSYLVLANRGLVYPRFRFFAFLSHLLDLTYYRIWFKRLAPRLPLPRRPLWRTWIRSRL